MWKFRELTDKVTNVVMNYSEVESKVREATNDDAWGPHGSLMQEVAQFTFTYEHFPEVMGMLWKRMLHDNKKNWRRVYKSLLLLNYLVRNGSERVVTSAREHLYDLRSLETYTFTDEHGKDQGLNVRQKCKEMIDFIQDDDRLRDERKKSKKNKDKYVGLSSENGSHRYSDRYDEEPTRTNSSSPKHHNLDEIDDWDKGKKSIATEAVDKVKDLWQRVHGKRTADDVVDYSDDPDNKCDDENNGPAPGRRYSQYHDGGEEFTSVERTRTTHTEKITNRRTTRTGKKLDLGAAATFGKDDTTSQSSSTLDCGPSLMEMPVQGSKQTEDFADFQAAAANGDFNPRAVAGIVQASPVSIEAGDFTALKSASSPTSPQGGFADFTQFNQGPSVSPVNTSSSKQDLFDIFGGGGSSSPIQPTGGAPLQPVSVMSAPPMMMAAPGPMTPMNPGMSPGMSPMQTGGTTIPQMGMMGMGMNVKPQMSNVGMMGNMNYMGIQATGQQPMGMPPAMMSQGMLPNMGMGYSPSVQSKAQLQSNNTWTSDMSKVNISLDGLNPASKYQKTPSPSMNQLQQQSMMGPGGNAPQGMGSINQGMAGMSIGQQGPMMGPSVMGQPHQVMGAGGMGMGVAMQPVGMGMHGGMMGPMGGSAMGTMGTQSTMTMQGSMAGSASFQQRTDQAFGAFGNVTK
ncbi:hypothetical protein ScPMuIL_006510 [Solemya velum]